MGLEEGEEEEEGLVGWLTSWLANWAGLGVDVDVRTGQYVYNTDNRQTDKEERYVGGWVGGFGRVGECGRECECVFQKCQSAKVPKMRPTTTEG